MTDETQQESEHPRKAPAPPASEVGEQETGPAGGLAAAEVRESFGILSDEDDRARALSELTDDSLRGLHAFIEKQAELTDDDRRDLEQIALELQGRQQLDVDQEIVPELNAANRICVQLRRIADALGHDTIPFDAETDFTDIERVELRLMDIGDALEGRSWGQGRTPGAETG